MDNQHKDCHDFIETLKNANCIDTRPNPIDGSQEDNRRVVDLHDRDEISGHVARFIAHSTARRIEPSLDVILDYLYSKKTYSEKDDFVRIERLIEMIKENKVYPILIIEVLNYALSVEKAAIEVLNDNIENVDKDKHLKALQEALAVRLSV